MNFLILVKLGTIIVIILTVDESEEMSVLIKPTFVLISDINLMLKISQITWTWNSYGFVPILFLKTYIST